VADALKVKQLYRFYDILEATQEQIVQTGLNTQQ
jgi:hypothetical protein